MKTSQLATLCFTCLLIIIPITASAQPYVISPNGLEVTDQKTGLIWRRCVEGMEFVAGTCTAIPSVPQTFTYDLALAQAKSSSAATQLAWRMPNVKELASIADKSLSNPAIDTVAFPATPTNIFWSTSPNVGNPSYARSVNFSYGDVSSYRRTTLYYVRLVRAGQ